MMTRKSTTTEATKRWMVNAEAQGNNVFVTHNGLNPHLDRAIIGFCEGNAGECIKGVSSEGGMPFFKFQFFSEQKATKVAAIMNGPVYLLPS